jgi:hypothetical protein
MHSKYANVPKDIQEKGENRAVAQNVEKTNSGSGNEEDDKMLGNEIIIQENATDSVPPIEVNIFEQPIVLQPSPLDQNQGANVITQPAQPPFIVITVE